MKHTHKTKKKNPEIDTNSVAIQNMIKKIPQIPREGLDNSVYDLIIG